MEDPERLTREYELQMLRHEHLAIRVQLVVARRRRRRRNRQRRRFWIRPWVQRREEFGIYDQLLVELRREDTVSFVNFLRMAPGMFDELLERIGPRISKQRTRYRAPLEPGLKLALTLRHLASGSKFVDMQYAWRVPKNTICLAVKKVCDAIVEEYKAELMTCPTTPDEWRQIARDFYRKWNFPHCLGALDGKHVSTKCPFRSGSLYYNYKGFYSVVLFALVDANYRFIWADIGGKGSASDAQIYNQSELKEAMETGTLGLPDPDPLPNDNEPAPYYFIADDAFGLREHLLKPYALRGLTHDERIFNYRLSRARRVVENAFGILANRFGILHTTMYHHPSTVRIIVQACLMLHNLMRNRFQGLQDAIVDREMPGHRLVPGAWRQGRSMNDVQAPRGHNVDNFQGKRLRNLVKHWCNSPAGSVAFPFA